MMNEFMKVIQSKMKEELSCAAHAIDHVMRVYELSKLIASKEKSVNMEIVEPAALLHDIARVAESKDKTGSTDHAVLGAKMAEKVLKEIHYPEELIEPIKKCIETHRFRSNNEPQSIEAKILFDADKLDVIGAIGIARSFMLAGTFKQQICARIAEDYYETNIGENGRIKDVSKHSPFMEYEYKFKKIPSTLYTDTGKEIGKERLAYMETYFNRLDKELQGTL